MPTDPSSHPEKNDAQLQAPEVEIAKLTENIRHVRQYARSDPEAALHKARYAAEIICRRVFEDQIGRPSSTMTLEKFIESLGSNRLVPSSILTLLRSVQRAGNWASHPQDGFHQAPLEMISTSMSSLAGVTRWYFEDYLHTDPRYEIREWLRRMHNLHTADDVGIRMHDSPYVAASFGDLLIEGLDEESIFEAASRIYSEFPAAEIPPGYDGSNDFGDDLKWDQLIRNCPDTFNLIMHRPSGDYIAYWHAISITDELYDQGLLGQNINKKCSHDHVRCFELPGDHNLYFVDLFRVKKYNNSSVNRLILSSFIDYLYRLALDGHFVSRILAHASTIEAVNLCKDLRFNFICKHKEHRRYAEDTCQGAGAALVPTDIYELILKDGGRRLFSYNQKLSGLYQDYWLSCSY